MQRSIADRPSHNPNLGGHFGPESKYLDPPPKDSQLRRRHPPGPSPSWNPTPPGIFNKNRSAPPPPGASDSPFPLPEQNKLKNVRNVHQGIDYAHALAVFKEGALRPFTGKTRTRFRRDSARILGLHLAISLSFWLDFWPVTLIFAGKSESFC